MYPFGQIMNYGGRENREVFRELLGKLESIVPFVGAGLTAFAYPTWGDALNALAEKIDEQASEMEARRLVSEWKYEAAAELIGKKLSDEVFRQRTGKLFSTDKLDTKRGIIDRQAISLLPKLVNGLVMTTNFDEGLEYVYPDFEYIFRPTDSEAFISGNREHSRALFKLHGTVRGSEVLPDEKIVFTTAQYNEAYSPGSPLVNKLRETFEKKIILFLGCSLTVDRTMELLDQVRDLDNQDRHYAIVSCKPGQQKARRLELEAHHIFPIFYEDGRHEAVRVVLEELLRLTNKDEYYNLPYHESVTLEADMSRFVYNSDRFDYVPRDEKYDEFGGKTAIELLYDFLEADGGEGVKWWAVVGDGGSGKSRLAYQLKAELERAGKWNVRYITRDDYDNLDSLIIPNGNTLLIADYVQQYAKELGKWMTSRSTTSLHAGLRILLIERDAGENAFDTSWVEQLKKSSFNRRKLEKRAYNWDFLHLKPLSDDALLKIINNYANGVGTTLPVGMDREILDRLKEIDAELRRPLYAMFLTDACLENGDKPLELNKEEILDYFTQRELERIERSVYQVLPNLDDERVVKACQRMLYAATVWQDAEIGEIKEIFSDDWARVDRYFDPAVLLRRIGLAKGDTVEAMRPDIMGEYIVLDWLINNPGNSGKFIKRVWTKPEKTNTFYDRLIRDYYRIFNERPERWLILFQDVENSEIMIASHIVNATAACSDVTVIERLTEISRKYHEKCPYDPDVLLRYAGAMYNLSYRQPTVGEKKVTLYTLAELTKKSTFPYNLVFATIFAEGLVKLISKQDSISGSDTIEKLEGLFFSRYMDNSEIAEWVARGKLGLIRSLLLEKRFDFNAWDSLEGFIREQEARGIVFSDKMKNGIAKVKESLNIP